MHRHDILKMVGLGLVEAKGGSEQVGVEMGEIVCGGE